MILCCVECIVDARIDSRYEVKNVVTIADGDALCADHMMPLIQERARGAVKR